MRLHDHVRETLHGLRDGREVVGWDGFWIKETAGVVEFDVSDRLVSIRFVEGLRKREIDLRWNGGGLADQMKRIAAALMGAGVLVGSIVERSGQSEMRSSTYTKRYTGPLVVLVGPLSGSASEILAAAVQDQKRGRLVGRMTNGSVLQSQQFALPDSGYVQVPISNYFRNDGQRIEGVGVEPDVWILPTLDDVRAKRDPVLDRALQELKK